MYSPEMNVFAIQPSDVVQPDLARKLAREADEPIPTLKCLLWPIGDWRSQSLIRDLGYRQAELIYRALLAQVAPRLTIPACFGSARDGSIALSSTNASIGAAEWYGFHFDPWQSEHFPERNSAARSQILRELERFCPADICACLIFPYLGSFIYEACGVCGYIGLAEGPESQIASCLTCGVELYPLPDTGLDRSMGYGLRLPRFISETAPPCSPEDSRSRASGAQHCPRCGLGILVGDWCVNCDD
jgi:hypothetical protein